MKIPVEISFISMERLTSVISQGSGVSKPGLFKQKNALIEENPLSVYYFFTDSAKQRIRLFVYHFLNLFRSHIRAIIYKCKFTKETCSVINVHTFIYWLIPLSS